MLLSTDQRIYSNHNRRVENVAGSLLALKAIIETSREVSPQHKATRLHTGWADQYHLPCKQVQHYRQIHGQKTFCSLPISRMQRWVR